AVAHSPHPFRFLPPKSPVQCMPAATVFQPLAPVSSSASALAGRLVAHPYADPHIASLQTVSATSSYWLASLPLASSADHFNGERSMKLYYAPNTCSLATEIVAAEAGIVLERDKVDLATHRTSAGVDYRTVSPLGY